MTEKNTCTWSRPLSLPVRIALCAAIGASLAVSNDPATGIAIAGGLFVALTAAGNRR
jgi:hypothetical protein